MNELDEVWSQMLMQATARAEVAGNYHVVEYLRLKATNDAIRKAGVSWLFDTAIEIAGRAMRDNAFITMDREEPHNFSRGSSNMVGSLLNIRQGVRCLSIEAGWTRTPSDGIMQKGALAYARIIHFGMAKFGAEIRLAHRKELPEWLGEDGSSIDIAAIERHFDLFMGR